LFDNVHTLAGPLYTEAQSFEKYLNIFYLKENFNIPSFVKTCHYNFNVQVDLQECTVSTLAGTGHQGNDKEGGGNGTEQSISSPWDVIVGPAPGTCISKWTIPFMFNS
jgi:hypothetical protein